MNYQQIHDRLIKEILPQCSVICRSLSSLSEKDADNGLAKIHDLVIAKILSPLSQLDIANQEPGHRHSLTESVCHLMIYIEQKRASVNEDYKLGIDGPGKSGDDEIKEAMAMWGWLESESPPASPNQSKRPELPKE
ncbi:hypothetical protein FHL15_009410 [Xylaria flabelliformis]|uniref:Uncharacterized protein n=1 Tax=Xylaria flabelliformis TaxID=2512241 RepID=A0A553HNZ9_9PEZI|nr:hypothetical protein FHL15_009410 [Xylaria flabelliformis]